MKNSSAEKKEDHLLALGDCNTRGVTGRNHKPYPDIVGEILSLPVENCGHTMSTVREAWEYAIRMIRHDTRCLLIQYGLVDSWQSVRGMPYVLNFPDHFFRRILRKLVKSIKRRARKMGLIKLLGSCGVVPVAEYEHQLTRMIRHARSINPGISICLIATVPSLESHRNEFIMQYNASMKKVSEKENCDFVDCYEDFSTRRDLYLDVVHITDEGHKILGEACARALEKRIGQ